MAINAVTRSVKTSTRCVSQMHLGPSLSVSVCRDSTRRQNWEHMCPPDERSARPFSIVSQQTKLPKTDTRSIVLERARAACCNHSLCWSSWRSSRPAEAGASGCQCQVCMSVRVLVFDSDTAGHCMACDVVETALSCACRLCAVRGDVNLARACGSEGILLASCNLHRLMACDIALCFV